MQNLDLTVRTIDIIEDVGALQQVLERAPRYSLNVSGALQPANAAEEVFSTLPDSFCRSQKYVYGIFLSSQLIGCIDVLRGFPSEEIATIGLLLLADGQQRKGRGKSAYESLEGMISAWHEVVRVRISVVETNSEVLGFWNKMGFKETGVRRPYENGSIKSEAIILEKPLDKH